MNKQETAKILFAISSVYQSFETNDAKVAIWHEMLKDIDFKYVFEGLKRVIKKSERIPTIAEIRNEAGITQYLNGGGTLDEPGDRKTIEQNTVGIQYQNE